MSKEIRLPPWTSGVIVLGGAATYLAVGILLEGVRFTSNLHLLVRDPGTFLQGETEAIAPIVLLLIPAVLGGLEVRRMLRIVFEGRRRGDSAGTIAKALAMSIGGAVLLVLAALFTSSKGSYH